MIADDGRRWRALRAWCDDFPPEHLHVVGGSTGRSPGWAPFRRRSTPVAARRPRRLLAAFGETGWFGGLAPFSGSKEGRQNRVIPVGEFLNFPY
jgi:hypothetical protein